MDGGGTMLFVSLLLAGLASSLHCAGMCGPLLLAFNKVVQGEGQGNASGMRLWFPYHTGRIWTYALLGFAAGVGGFEVRRLASFLGWQKPAAIAAAVLILMAGAIALGLIPGLRQDFGLSNCLMTLARRRPWLHSLLRDSRGSARLLLGAVMGLLPCAMVYGALVIAAALPTPLHSSLGMVCFGLGTLPSLSAVTWGSRLAPRWLRIQGPKLTALIWIGVGLFILLRAFLGGPEAHAHH